MNPSSHLPVVWVETVFAVVDENLEVVLNTDVVVGEGVVT